MRVGREAYHKLRSTITEQCCGKHQINGKQTGFGEIQLYKTTEAFRSLIKTEISDKPWRMYGG